MVGPTRRASRIRIEARGRRQYLAERIGRALFEARSGSARLQRDIADRAGISQSFYSRIERGGGAKATLETLAACALACDVQLAAFLEALPGATLPRDIEHVRRQQAVMRWQRVAAGERWPNVPSIPTRDVPARST
jgi:transcriptional regulator with XRE-family HTH domain